MRKKLPKTIEYNPVCDPKRMHGYRGVRWVENVSCGLRLVGFADEIARKEGSRSIDHKGWYTYDDGDPDDTLRGVVYQLPARHGLKRYVYGYADPNNDDCALLSFDPEFEVMDAARAADRFAELFAEEERDFHRAWDAGRRYDDLADEIKEMRTEALQICAEMREARRTGFNAPSPTICYALRARVGILYRNIQQARKKRAQLLDDYGSRDGFKE